MSMPMRMMESYLRNLQQPQALSPSPSYPQKLAGGSPLIPQT